LASPVAAQPTVPAGFAVTSLTPGVTFNLPTCLAFLPDGRALVGEKRGRVYLVDNGARTLLWSAEPEVLDIADSGLEDVAVDPDFPHNGRIYLLYDVDPDSAGTQDAHEYGFGRLVRYQMGADGRSLDPASRTVLMGSDWAHGNVITAGVHTVASIRFGADGSMLVSIGDGAIDTRVDAGHCPACRPDTATAALFGPGRTASDEDIGAFRAQDDSSLCGKILRLDPNTGLGLPDNPFFDGSPDSRQSRVYAKGLRNPYRFAVRPGTGGAGHPGTLYVGDVGWFSYEEIDVLDGPGRDFGWPCREGLYPIDEYGAATPKAFACRTLDASAFRAPVMTWPHDDGSQSVPPGIIGNCSIGGFFYTGAGYPGTYTGRYFFADYGGNWIASATFDAQDQLVAEEPFGTDFDGPTELAADPLNGDLCYVSILTGEVRRIHYVGLENHAPVAVATVSPPDSGRAPFTAHFSALASHDPDGQPLTYLWSFGDRTTSSEPEPAHTFQGGGLYSVILTATDPLGAVGYDTVVVTVSGPRRFPSTPVLDAFDRGSGDPGSDWSVGIPDVSIGDSTLVALDGASVASIWTDWDFGPDQEAFVTLNALPASGGRVGVRLKAPLPDTPGGVDVTYHPGGVEVALVDDSGIHYRLGSVRANFIPGDVLGARFYRDGELQVYQNRAYLGSVRLTNWHGSSQRGYVGLVLDGAAGAKLDDFGGGDIVSASTWPPIARILAPADHAFYVAGDTVRLVAAPALASDTLVTRFRWQVDTHHNNHVHPGTFVSSVPTDAFVAANHDDGTGVFLRVNLTLTRDGLVDSTSVNLYPARDLVAGPITVTPARPESGSVAEYRFTIRNPEPMLMPYSHWVLQADGVAIASGDTLVQAFGAVDIDCRVMTSLTIGAHTLRLTLDSLQKVVEMDESNNVQLQPLLVVLSNGPTFTAAPVAMPRAMLARISWATDRHARGVVYYGVTAAFGDSAQTRTDSTMHRVPLRGLKPETRYFFMVKAIDALGVVNVAPIDSFTTQRDTSVTDYALSEAFPNPSSGAVQMTLALPRLSGVRFQVFDVQGRQVWAEPERLVAPGRWAISWAGIDANGTPVRAGVYWARVTTAGRHFTRRLLRAP
jgi:glucose/arabinose dehydrogenase